MARHFVPARFLYPSRVVLHATVPAGFWRPLTDPTLPFDCPLCQRRLRDGSIQTLARHFPRCPGTEKAHVRL